MVTCSADGSVIVTADETVRVPAHPTEVLDTTGAGDLYAAGFIYAYTQGLDLATCGRLGSAAAAEVISHLGRPPSGAPHRDRRRRPGLTPGAPGL